MEKKPRFPFCLALAIVPLLGGFTSCSSSAPRILDVFQQLEVVREAQSGEQHEEFSFFLLVEDEDGAEDIQELVLTHSEEELRWSLTSGQWRELERDGELWIGGSGFRTNNRAPVPRGGYLVEVFDRAHESATTEFFISPDLIALQRGPLPERIFPQFVPDGAILIRGGGPQVNVFLSARDGTFLKSETVLRENVDKSVLQNWKNAGAATIRLHCLLEERGFGVIHGPFELTDVQ